MILDNEDILIQAAIDSARYEMVDLGLSVKWANKNVGASHPEDAGLYFQWGDTVGYTADQVGKDKVFDKYSYPERLNVKYNNSTSGLKVLKSSVDAATVNMGSNYRMPTYTEILELIDNTTPTFIDVDGNEYDKQYFYDNVPIGSGKLKGVRFTGLNGNSIFIPAAGSCNESRSYGVGINGTLWSSSLYDDYDNIARYLNFGCSGSYNICCSSLYYGRSVRGVQDILNYK